MLFLQKTFETIHKRLTWLLLGDDVVYVLLKIEERNWDLLSLDLDHILSSIEFIISEPKKNQI